MPRNRIFNTMKRLEIVLDRTLLPAVCALLDEHATGYTVIHEVTGSGHHGVHDGDIAMMISIVTPDHLDPVLDRLGPLLNDRSGIVTVSEVSVLRGEYFVPECARRWLGAAHHSVS